MILIFETNTQWQNETVPNNDKYGTLETNSIMLKDANSFRIDWWDFTIVGVRNDTTV
jgi:hypothetical protein